MFTLPNDGLTTMERNILALDNEGLKLHLRIARNKGALLSYANMFRRIRPQDLELINQEVKRLGTK